MGDLGNFENLVHGVVPIIHRGRSYHSCGQQSKMGWDKRSSFGKKQKKKRVNFTLRVIQRSTLSDSGS